MINNMKVIDLLNKIANGEEVPKKIAIQNDILIYNDSKICALQDWYYRCDGEDETWKIWAYDLKDEVEIIEEENKLLKETLRLYSGYDREKAIRDEYDFINDFKKEEDKKIEKLNIELNSNDENKVNCYRATNIECDMAFKINEIIDEINKR